MAMPRCSSSGKLCTGTASHLLVPILLLLLLHATPWSNAAATESAASRTRLPTPLEPPPSPDVRHLYGRLLGDFNCEQVAFYKTHKTGSTDLGAILFRVGVRHSKRFHTSTPLRHYLNASSTSKPADFVINHSKSSMRAMQDVYRKYLGGHPGRLTILRDPVTRYVSDFYYFVHPLHRTSVLGGKGVQPQRNRMTSDLAGEPAQNMSVLADFFGSEEWQGTVFLRLEQLTEGLAALHLHCGWPIKYLLNFNVNCAGCGRRLVRWDGLEVQPHGAVSSELRQRILSLHKTDTMLIQAVDAKWREVRRKGGQALQAAAAEVKRQQALVEAFCREGGSDGGQRPACVWLSLMDLEYEKAVSPDTGRVSLDTPIALKQDVHPGVPEMRLQDMIADYDRVYEQVVGSPPGLHHQHDVEFLQHSF